MTFRERLSDWLIDLPLFCFIFRALHRQDKMYSSLSSLAMEMTQRVTQLQGQERAKFVEHIKKTMTEKIQIKKSWQQVVQNLTHER